MAIQRNCSGCERRCEHKQHHTCVKGIIPKYFLVGNDQPNAEILVVHDDGRVYYCGWGGCPQDVPDYAAIGSGSEYAVGAMHMGASAIRAVEAAICHDSNSGTCIYYAERGGDIIEYKG